MHIMGLEFDKEQLIYEIRSSVINTKMIPGVSFDDVHDYKLIEVLRSTDDMSEDDFNSLDVIQQKILIRICMRVRQKLGLQERKS
ncbi:MAG: hypothetical protein ACRC3J_05010 [Culicoidibacterales bacterium]